MRYYLPTINSNKQGFTELAKLKEALNNSNDDNLIINFSKCTFFDANMAASLKAVLSISTKIVVIEKVSRKIEHILRKNKFLCAYRYLPMKDINHTTLPCQQFNVSNNLAFNQYLDMYLQGKGIPKMSPALKEKFKESIFEIFANCAVHANSSQGIFVCGQFYPRKNRLDLTISDTGIGIRTNVRRFLNNQMLSSIDAIRWAIEEGNITKTGSEPGGLGLALLQSFVEHNNGKIQIVSRKGYYEFNKGKNIFKKLDADFLGTTINLEINTNDSNSYYLSSEISSEDIF